MLTKLINFRIISLGGWLTLPIMWKLELFFLFMFYEKKFLIAITFLILYLIVPHILPYRFNNSVSWHTSRGIYIFIDKIRKRSSFIWFYPAIYIASYAMAINLLYNGFGIGILAVALIFFGKIIFNITCYFSSKYQGYYQDFDERFIK
jgi:hypothetical protein